MSQKQLPEIPKVATTDWRPIAVPYTNRLEDDKGRQRPPKPWRPVTLQMPFLTAMILSTVGLIVLVQYLLTLSTRQQGIIFARSINSLPLSKTFGYLYLPTLISVIYSFLWTWVDLDVKRLEPFYQLSRPGGAKGSECILLSYPLEFLVAIPLSAFKRKHWSVLTTSTIMILVFWGLTPTQAGMFAIRMIDVDEPQAGSYSNAYTPINQQSNLSSTYAQSVYNIAWLNEKLPAFMTRDFALSPFGPAIDSPSNKSSITFTGKTTLYSVDVSCDEAMSWNRSGIWYYNSSQGCSFNAPRFRPSGGTNPSRPFDTLYVGYQNQDGFADYYLSSDCDERYFHLFFIRWSKSNPAYIEGANKSSSFSPDQANDTSLFCKASYFQQPVNATINLPSRSVVVAQPLGPKASLPADLFNVSSFEWTMSSGQEHISDRGEYPTVSFPDQTSQLLDMPLNLAYVPKMAPFAIGTTQWSAKTYLDSETLRASYESAYRLLFARQLVEILKDPGPSVVGAEGRLAYITEAVVIVPAFAYAAMVILGLVLALALNLKFICWRRNSLLSADPASVGALMDLVSGAESVTSVFEGMDMETSNDLEQYVQNKSFHLVDDGLGSVQLQASDSHEIVKSERQVHSSVLDKTPKGVRPLEMRSWVGLSFLFIQVAAFVTFLVLFLIARNGYGLPLPSQSTIVRQLVENYTPVVLATVMEPFWLVLNRLLGLLEPFEELLKGDAPASRSIDLDYSSLPPQLLFVRALRARHFKLANVCFMVLLANVLAVTLGGLMYEGALLVPKTTSMRGTRSATFLALNGTAARFNSSETASDTGRAMTIFYREMSNLTAGTPVPAWTDDEYSYLPLDLAGINSSSIVEVETMAFGTAVQCTTLQETELSSYNISFLEDSSGMHVTVAVGTNAGSQVECTHFKPWTRSSSDTDEYGQDYVRRSQSGHVSLEFNGMLYSETGSAQDDLFCRQKFLSGWLRADWDVIEGQNAGTTIRGLPKMNLRSRNQTLLLCTPSIRGGLAKIEVDANGQVQRRISGYTSVDDLDQYFPTSPGDIVAVANQYIIDSDSTWHIDPYPSDYLNYFIAQTTNDTSFLDSSLPVPASSAAAAALADVYQRLFGVFLSTNMDMFMADAPTNTTTEAQVLTPETRILFSTPAFIVSEIILACYVLTTIVFYFSRPWRILPRLPSTPASIIAFFAASKALQELGEPRRQNERRGAAIRNSWKWGYGSFTDDSARQHIGIEREPFVSALRRRQSSDMGLWRVRFWGAQKEREGQM